MLARDRRVQATAVKERAEYRIDWLRLAQIVLVSMDRQIREFPRESASVGRHQQEVIGRPSGDHQATIRRPRHGESMTLSSGQKVVSVQTKGRQVSLATTTPTNTTNATAGK